MLLRYVLLIWSCLLVLSACSSSNPSSSDTDYGTQATPTAIAISPENPTEVASMMEVLDPWVRASVDTGTQSGGRGEQPDKPRDRPGSNPGFIELDPHTTRAFMTFVNKQQEPDNLVAVSAEVAGNVEMFHNDSPDKINIVPQIEIPANGEITLERGPGYHLVLQDLTRELQVGDTITMTLTFWNAGEVEITAPVQLPYQSSQQ